MFHFYAFSFSSRLYVFLFVYFPPLDDGPDPYLNKIALDIERDDLKRLPSTLHLLSCEEGPHFLRALRLVVSFFFTEICVRSVTVNRTFSRAFYDVVFLSTIHVWFYDIYKPDATVSDTYTVQLLLPCESLRRCSTVVCPLNPQH